MYGWGEAETLFSVSCNPTSLAKHASVYSLYIQVARLGNGDTMSPPPSSSEGTSPSAASANATTADANPSPDAEGYEDWIKARAAAVGVPVALEKERQARCVLQSC